MVPPTDGATTRPSTDPDPATRDATAPSSRHPTTTAVQQGLKEQQPQPQPQQQQQQQQQQLQQQQQPPLSPQPQQRSQQRSQPQPQQSQSLKAPAEQQQRQHEHTYIARHSTRGNRFLSPRVATQKARRVNDRSHAVRADDVLQDLHAKYPHLKRVCSKHRVCGVRACVRACVLAYHAVVCGMCNALTLALALSPPPCMHGAA